MKQVIYMFVLIFVMASVGAQEGSVSFTLKEARDYAAVNNKTLKNASRDVLIADQQYKESRSSGLPQVNGSVDYMTNFNYEFTFGFGGGGAPPAIDYTLLDPGDLELLNYLSQSFGSSEPIVLEDQANASVTLSQLIFSGQYWVGMQLSKLGKQISEASLENTGLNVMEQVTNSYYLILVTEELLRNIEENQENLREVRQHTADMVRVGMAEQTDADQIGISLSQLENSRKAMQRSIELSYNMFRIVTGLSPGAQVTLADSLGSFTGQIEEDMAADRMLELSKVPSYKMLDIQEEMSRKSVDLQRWAYSPTLSGYYRHTEKVLKSDFDLSPKDAAGLTLSVPIFAGGAKQAQLSKARIELDKVQRSKSLVEEQLRMQDEQLRYNLQNAYENYRTQKQNVTVAGRVYENIKNKYGQGLVSSLDLTQANSNLLQAQGNYYNATLSVLQARLQLDKLYNDI